MKNWIFALASAFLLLAACQQETPVAPTETTLAARVEMASGTPASVYDSTSKVRVHLVAAGFDRRQTLSFDLHSCRFTGVPIDAPYVLTFEGLADDTTVVLWTGRKEGRTAASNGAGVTASVVAYAIHDTTLSSLELLPGIALHPAFDKNRTEYAAAIANGTGLIAVVAKPSDPTDSVFCNEGACNSVVLVKDTTEVRVKVKNTYGNSLLYKVTVVRALLPRDSTLSSLSTQPGKLNVAFSSSQTSYLDTVPDGTDSVSVMALPTILGDIRSITYNGNAKETVPLSLVGNTTIEVKVTNKNGRSLTYSITVVKRARAVAMDSTLSALSTSVGEFTAKFSPSVTSYTDSVPADTDSLVVNAVAKDSGAEVAIASNGMASSTVILAKTGPTTITIMVTNANHNALIYTIAVWKRAPKLPPRDSTLGSLSTDVGELFPRFADSIRAYVDSVPNNTTKIVVNADAKRPEDVKSITYNGSANDSVMLATTGNTAIEVRVTNLNDKSMSYTITVVRRPAEIARDSALGNLYTTPGAFDSAFLPARRSYVDSVPAGVTNIVVTAVARVPGDVRGITYNGLTGNTVTLATTGPTVVDVVVTNTNGRELAYRLVVVRKAAASLDTTKPAVARRAGTADTVVPASRTTFPVSWTATDNALNQVSIAGKPVVSAGAGVYAAEVSIPGDSNWIRMVAVDSSGNTTYDSVMVLCLSAPQVSPPGGYLSGAQTTTAILSKPLDADVDFSTNGSVWTRYRNGILVSESQILRVKATLRGVSVTDSVLFLYKPSFSVPTGAYDSEQEVELSAAGASGIEYSTDGGSNWTTYNNKLKVSASTRLSARSRLGGFVSPAVIATYAISPVVVPDGGTFKDSVLVRISGAGAELVEHSQDGGQTWLADTAFELNRSTTLQARTKIGDIYSPTTRASFAISHDTSFTAVVVNDGRDDYRATIAGTVITIDSLHGLASSVVLEFKPASRKATVKVNSDTSRVVELIDGAADVAIEVVNGPSTQNYRLALRTRGRDTIQDKRDSETYPVVRIGKQWWMAKNLNFVTQDTSWCYADLATNCATNGRLYPWHTAMGLDGKYDTTRWAGDLTGRLVTGICPEGWHVPNTVQWWMLVDAVGNDPAKLRIDSFYYGTNDFGFDGIPTGKRTAGNIMLTPYSSGPGAKDSSGFFWSASQYDPIRADRTLLYDREMNWTPGGETGVGVKTAGLGLRCLKD